jgi:hypothetical protein
MKDNMVFLLISDPKMLMRIWHACCQSEFDFDEQFHQFWPVVGRHFNK